MWVYSIKRSQLCEIGCWLCKHETALPTQFILETIRLQLCSSGTHRINTRSNVTVPDVSVFLSQGVIVSQLVLDYVSMRLSPSHNLYLETIRSPVVHSGTHESNTYPRTWCQSIPSQGVNCVSLVLDYLSMRPALPQQFIWRPSVPVLTALVTESIHVGMSLVPDVSVFHQRSQLCSIGCIDYVIAWDCSPSHNHLKTIHLQLCCLALTESIPRSNVTVPDVSVFPITRVNCVEIGVLDY